MLNFRQYKIGARLLATTVGALLLMLIFVGIALVNLNSITERVDHLANNNIKTTEFAVEMRTANLLIARRVRSAIIYEETAKQQDEKSKVAKEFSNYRNAEKAIGESLDSPEAKAIFARIVEHGASAESAVNKMFGLIMEGNRPAIEEHFAGEFREKMQAWYDAIGEFIELQKANNAHDLAEVERLKSGTQSTMLILILVALVVMIPSGLWITGQITAPLKSAVTFANSVASGRLDNEMDVSGADEPAELMQALARMQGDLSVRIEEERRVAAENARIKIALEGAATPLTISDASNTLVFMNCAATSLWQSMEDDMARRIPGFTVAGMQHHSLVDFFDDEEMKSVYRQELTSPRTLDVSMCGRSLRVTATPVRNATGEYLGRASQWVDRTAEVAIEEEVSNIIRAASAGDFSQRIDTSALTGFFRQISDGINGLLETTSRSMSDVGGMLTRLSQGDLTRKIEADYSGMLGNLKDDANATVDNLREIIVSIKGATDAINTAAQEIASGNQDLSSRTEEQASSLEQTASSMETLTGTVRQNAENARQASQLAGEAQKIASRGGEVVGQVVETMTAIHDSSSRIADIIGVIDGIAFQTNILALNAAVEAARAGEQGRGFAVVATEVRNLAQRSAGAAKEIKGLISDSVGKVEVGNKLVNQAGKTMQEVVASIQRVAHLMADISRATVEQSQGIESVSEAVGKMDESTQQNAALVEQAAAAAESLEEQARQLAQSVSVFALAETSGQRLLSKPVKQVALPHVNPAKLESMPAKRLELMAPEDDEWAEF